MRRFIVLAISFLLLSVLPSVANAVTVTFVSQNQDGTHNRHALLCKGLGCAGTEDYGESFFNGSVTIELSPGDVVEIWHRYNYKKNPSYGVNAKEGETWFRFVVPSFNTTFVSTFRNKYLPGGNEPGIDPTELEFVNLLNNHRQSLGLQPLSLVKGLSFTSDSHATFMLNNGTYDHYGLYGWGSSERNTDYGLKVITDEAIHNGHHKAYDALASLLNSPPHRLTLENSSATHMGIGRMGFHWVINTSLGCDVDCGSPDFISQSRYHQVQEPAPIPSPLHCGSSCGSGFPTVPSILNVVGSVPARKKTSSANQRCKVGWTSVRAQRTKKSSVLRVTVNPSLCGKKAKLRLTYKGGKARTFKLTGKRQTLKVRVATKARRVKSLRVDVAIRVGKKSMARKRLSLKGSRAFAFSS